MFSFLKNPEKYQKDLFLNLSDRGLNKLLSLMKDNNETIRKMSFLVIINLLYNNEVLQNIFCEKYNFNPIGNVICINWLPSVFKEKIPLDTNLILELKKSSSLSMSNTKYWKWPNNPKYTDDLIPDPERYLLGFYYSSKVSVTGKNENVNYVDIQSIIDSLEEGFEATPLNLGGNEGKNGNALPTQNMLKEEYKKNKAKNPSRSIDYKVNDGLERKLNLKK